MSFRSEGAAAETPKSPEEIVRDYQGMTKQQNGLAERISELEQKLHEHE